MILGFVNVDFVDVCVVMKDSGIVMFGVGVVSGKGCVEEVARVVMSVFFVEYFID